MDRIFARAGELGINLIDTAECYGDHLSESLIGRAIEKDRAKWIVATKFGHKFHGFMNRTEPREPPDVVQQLDESLTALRTDYIDLYQFHSWGNKDFDQPGVWDVLREAGEGGKDPPRRQLDQPAGQPVPGGGGSTRRTSRRSRSSTTAWTASPSRPSCPRASGSTSACWPASRWPAASSAASTSPAPPSPRASSAARRSRKRSTSGSARPRRSAGRKSRRAWTWPSGPWRGA